jgi:hypothetical protein
MTETVRPKHPSRPEIMDTIRKEYYRGHITIMEASYLFNYCEQVHKLMAPPNEEWQGSVRDWNQLHCAYGLMGELLELENETNLIPIIKEFGDILFYLINLVESTNSWKTLKYMIHDDLAFDEDFYCHLNFKACLIRHVDVIADMIKRRIFYGNRAVDEVMITRHIVSALVFLKLGYASCLNGYEEIYNKIQAACTTPEESAHWKDVMTSNDETIFTETRDLRAIANRNLNKLLTGKNARYASGKFSLEDSIAKKDAVEDGKDSPTPEASL